MRITLTLMLAVFGLVNVVGQENSSLKFNKTFELDSVSSLRNPAMGWMIYEEGASFQDQHKNYDPIIFWEEMDEVSAEKYANILYIRVHWKIMEPEEGKYAWKFNKAYQEYIKKAEDRGLKLAFRIFFDNGTPDWVYAAGSESTLDPPMSFKNDKQPYYDDPIFLSKLENFIKAFAEEYDNPDRVDFIDAYGLGRWGEGHGVTLKDQKNYKKVIEKVTGDYARHFKKILTVYSLSRNDWHISKAAVFDKLGFLPRRDGVGSHWYDATERAYMAELFPSKAFIGEGCYWFGARDKDTTYQTKTAFFDDKRFPRMRTWNDALSVAVDDAIASRSNTFDLRTPFETKTWIEKLPRKVQEFITYGGYRLYAESVSVNQNNRTFSIAHYWRNFGVGVLPNNHPNWNNKYKVAFALINSKSGNVVYSLVDPIANPGKWIQGELYGYRDLNFTIPKSVKKGSYQLAIAIIDTTTGKAGIKLAIKDNQLINDWAVIHTIDIK